MLRPLEGAIKSERTGRHGGIDAAVDHFGEHDEGGRWHARPQAIAGTLYRKRGVALRRDTIHLSHHPLGKHWCRHRIQGALGPGTLEGGQEWGGGAGWGGGRGFAVTFRTFVYRELYDWSVPPKPSLKPTRESHVREQQSIALEMFRAYKTGSLPLSTCTAPEHTARPAHARTLCLRLRILP